MITFDVKPMPIDNLPRYNLAHSVSAQTVQTAFESLWHAKGYVHTYAERPMQIVNQLLAAVSECLTPNWDGEGAKPVSDVTIANARQFLLLIPKHLPLPEITVDHDGEISFEWYVRKYRSFSLSIGENRMMSYAGSINSSKWYGVGYLSDAIPDTILNDLSAVLK